MTESTPRPLGPYSPIVRAGEFLIVSGQTGAKDGVLVARHDAQSGTRVAQVVAELAPAQTIARKPCLQRKQTRQVAGAASADRKGGGRRHAAAD